MSNSAPRIGEPTILPIQRWPTRRAKLWVSRFLDSCVLDDNVAAVIAVGSAVRMNVPSVDLDLVVLVKDVSRLKVKAPIEVDLRAYPLIQVDALIASGTDLLGWAVNYGKVVSQKENAWDRILEKWQGKVPMPLPEIAHKRANDAFRRFTNMMEVGDFDAAYEQALSYVTHLARAELINNNRYPASRPELPSQLRMISCSRLASVLEKLICRAIHDRSELAALMESIKPH
jgi:hypothetical protein